MYHILIGAISILICYKFGDWRNWKNYYPTILFFILSSVLCTLLTYNHILWEYESRLMNHTFCNLLICITVYPSTVMIFIPYFPKKIIKIIPYISIYAVVYIIGEFISVKLGYFTYHNGWNIWGSIIFDFLMFPLLILHYKKPIYGWILVLIGSNILFFIMKIPYNNIR